MASIFNTVRTHWKYTIVYLILVCLCLNGLLKPGYTPLAGDPDRKDIDGTDYTSTSLGQYYTLKYAMEKGDYFPLWSPYMFSGQPFFQKILTPTVFHFTPWMALFISVETSINISIILQIFFAALFMYILAYYLTGSKIAAFFAGLLYEFNGLAVKFMRMGWVEYIREYWVLPIIFLVLILLVREKIFKKKIRYALFISLLLSYQVYNGGGYILLYTLLGVGIFFAYILIPKFIAWEKKSVVSIILLGILILAPFIGISALRIIPSTEFSEYTNRAHINYEQRLYQNVPWNHMFGTLVFRWPPSTELVFSGTQKIPHKWLGIGITSFLIISFWLWGVAKKRKIQSIPLCFLTIAIISVLISTGGLLFYLLVKFVPGFSFARYPHRALVLFALSSSVLLAYAIKHLVSRMSLSFAKKTVKAVIIIIFILMLVDLIVFADGFNRTNNLQELRSKNHAMNFIANQTGIFRIHTYEQKGIDYAPVHHTIPLKLQSIYGYEGTWSIDYLPRFLSYVNTKYSIGLGILNAKYVTSMSELNKTGLRLVDKFDECKECTSDKVDGPYVYENEEFLPRFFMVEKGILVVGEKQNAENFIYNFMVNPKFSPKKHIFVYVGNNLERIPDSHMQYFDSAIITSSIPSNDFEKLRSYWEKGGKVFPKIFEGKNSIDTEEMEEVFNIKNNFEEAVAVDYGFDTHKIKTGQTIKEGILVCSEKYTVYPGWHSKINGKRTKIFRAFNIVSSIIVPESDEIKIVEFEYSPSHLKLYTTLALASLIATIGGIIYLSKGKQLK